MKFDKICITPPGTLLSSLVWPLFMVRSQNCEKQLLASSCLFVRMEQLVSHWPDFH